MFNFHSSHKATELDGPMLTADRLGSVTLDEAQSSHLAISIRPFSTSGSILMQNEHTIVRLRRTQLACILTP